VSGNLFVAKVDEERCVGCEFCQSPLYCPSPQACVGCGVCVQGCPHQAREMVADDEPRAAVNITVNGQPLSVPERITVKRAIELAGLSFGVEWGEGDVAAPSPSVGYAEREADAGRGGVAHGGGADGNWALWATVRCLPLRHTRRSRLPHRMEVE
jgi:ferredoxin